MKTVKQEKFPFMQHPGKIFYMKRDNKTHKLTFTIYVEKSVSFTVCLYLTEDMVTDQRKTRYEEALDIIV